MTGTKTSEATSFRHWLLSPTSTSGALMGGTIGAYTGGPLGAVAGAVIGSATGAAYGLVVDHLGKSHHSTDLGSHDGRTGSVGSTPE